MTTNQIKSIITSLGFEMNKIIDLKSEVSSIYTEADDVFYPGPTTRFEFHTNDGCELMLVYYGKTKEDGTFEATRNIPKAYVPFRSIEVINMISPVHGPEPYRYGRTV